MTANGIVDAVAEYIDTNLSGQAFAVVGISFGGFVARCLHVRYEPLVLGSSLLAPAVKPSGRRQLNAEESVYVSDGFELAKGDSDAKFIDSFRSISPIHTRASWESYVEHIVPGYRVHDVEAYEELIQNYDPELIRESSGNGRLGGNNLIIAGKQDALVGWKDQFEVVAEYENVSYAALDGAGHNVHLDQPAIVGLLLRDWLSRISRSTSGTAPLAMK